VHWYANVPAAVKLRDTEPATRFGTFAGEPVAGAKVTLCTTPVLLVQVTVPERVIATEDGLNEFTLEPYPSSVLLIATFAVPDGFPPGGGTGGGGGGVEVE